MGNGCRKVGSILASQFLFYLFISQFHAAAVDIISQSQSITDGQFLTSAGGIYELGFFRPSNSSKIYVGIWHKRITQRKVVWVANREKPITDSLGSLTISSNGNLVILDGNGNTIWTTNTSSVSSAVAVLLDTGNLVLKENSTLKGKFLWESFSYPSNTLLPSMEIRSNIKTGDKRVLSSWKSEDDPSPGNFIVGLDSKRPVQAYVWDISNGSVPYFRSGLWNGKSFIGIEGMDTVYFNGFSLTASDPEVTSFTFSVLNSTLASFLVVNSSGVLTHVTWNDVQNEWIAAVTQNSQCEIYGTCGPYGICNKFHSPICRCMRGFEPKYSEDWHKGRWRDGCVRRTELQCGKNTTNSAVKEDEFLQLRGMKLPDFAEFMEFFEAEKCKVQCLNNCSCVGYAHVSGLWCLVWSRELMDIQEFSIGGEDFFLRLASSEFSKNTWLMKLAIIIPVVTFATCTISVIGYLLFRRKTNQRGTSNRRKGVQVDLVNTKDTYNDSPRASMLRDGYNEGETPELQLFDFSSMKIATNNFSLTNKLGEGGFGPVYKGTLQNGQEIAIKRLSKSSGQGTEEFKNEVILISKLQHRNLVKLLGCCVDGEEQMLLYEYMPNRSLDALLFDPRKRVQLDWDKRFNIIEGIARGLLYLHRDSRLKVIHRDLKASNILLDEDMNPKISDFGMARIFGGTQTMANTNRVVGTFGYMAPEYIMGGTFSEKSDVFSFGVLILEIVSSKRNKNCHPEQPFNLLVHTWRLWSEGQWPETVDEVLGDSYSLLEVKRCIHVGLLCVQKRPVDRPTMSAVDLMLTSEIDRPPPKEPPFTSETSSELFSQVICSNDATVTLIEGR